MAGFSELIKTFEKIREYSRDFFVYGYKCRSDYDQKSGRSYDNERRRIESYLSGYIKWETSARGKSLFISTDTSDLSHNLLFSLWETKSFTKNDCMLHFCLTDILKESPGSTLQTVTSILSDQYLSCFDDCRMPDSMTVRNKLNEYADAGIFSIRKEGKTVCYFLSPNFLEQFGPEARNNLSAAIQFFENTTPAGFLGYFIRRDNASRNEVVSIRHLFMAHSLDDEILVQISNAITDHRSIRFDNYSKRRKALVSETVLPLKIAINVRHGRSFLISYNFRLRQFFSYRLDHIKNVEALEPNDGYKVRLDELERRLPYVWGVFLGLKEQREKIELVLHIDEATEEFVLARLRREGKNGTIEKVADNTFVYRNEVYDTMEMVPWIRTFIGRIIAIQGSNKPVIERFINDMRRMVRMYQ